MLELTRQETRALVGVRRLLVLLSACLPEPPADPEPATLTLILKELKSMSETFDTEMTKLRDDVAAQSTVISSATEAFRGLAAQLVAAEAAAKNAGATDAQVAGVTNLRQQLEANTASLAAAIPANTDASTPTPAATASVPDAASTTTPSAATAAPVTAPVTPPETSSVPATPPATPSTPVDATATPAL